MSFAPDSIRIEPLGPSHDRGDFDSGHAALDRYLAQQAGQDGRRGMARVFVATAIGQPRRILGFYSLSAVAVMPAHLPPDQARRLPRHPIPAALIGRLAVDRTVAGRGLGGILIADALLRTKRAAEHVAMAALVVDPIDDAVRAFWSAYGLVPLQGAERRMFLPVE
ncbi:MAG: GNAT family N-acetyltransferase [Rhodospirillales bacterium]|nr:GNAT family N-acetyltransferase [Rhodospirillales bacterium]